MRFSVRSRASPFKTALYYNKTMFLAYRPSFGVFERNPYSWIIVHDVKESHFTSEPFGHLTEAFCSHVCDLY